jgi:hypothetical protein
MRILKLSILIGTFLILSLTFYQLSFLSKDVYFITKGKAQRESLAKEIKELEIKLSEASSLSNLDQFLANSNFVKSNGTKFIQVFESGVAAK